MPGAAGTKVFGINDQGDAVGSFTDASGRQHGFVDLSGHITELDVRGALSTEILGINNNRTIVGEYTGPGGHLHGFEAIPGGHSFSDMLVAHSF